MKRLLEKIKQYKWAFMGLVILALIIIAWLLFNPKMPPTGPDLTPVIVKEKEEEKGKEVSENQNGFYIEETIPKSGKTKILGEYTIISYKFNKPIVIEGIKILVDPPITIKREFSEDRRSLYISPRSEPWLDKTKYIITISNIRSIEGDSLGSPIIHEYYNEIPQVTEWGDMMTESP